MALSGQYSTYLERSVDAAISIPCDIQRLLSTIKDLDVRVAELKAQGQSQCEHICQQPSAASRQATAEQVAHVATLREQMEKDQKNLTFLANEKIFLTNQALNMIGGHVKRMDAELAEFKTELVITEPTLQFDDFGGFVNGDQDGPEESLLGGGTKTEPPLEELIIAPAPSSTPRPPRSHDRRVPDPASSEPPRKTQRTNSGHIENEVAITPSERPVSGHRSNRTPSSSSNPGSVKESQNGQGKGSASASASASQRANLLQQGDQVAACVSSTETDELEWIMGTVARWINHSNRYEVRDEEAGEGETQSHMLPPERVILLPKSNHSRDHPLVLQPSSEVLAVYPGTTTFYKAFIINAARRHKSGEYGDYLLEFEDDAEGGMLAQRPAAFRHVVPYPAHF